VSILVGNDPHARQIDVLLPAAVPLAALVEPTRTVLNQRLRQVGAEELPVGTSFVFARAAGMTLLADNLSLAAQGIHDAELLAFLPARSAQRYEPNIENVSAAIATWAKAHFPAVSAADAARVAVGLTLVVLAISSVMLLRLRWGGSPYWVTPATFGAAALVLAVTSLLSARLRAERVLTAATTWASLGALVLGAATTPPGTHPGAPHAFLAAIVAVVASTVVARVTGRYRTAATAIATVSVAAAGAAAARMVFDVPGQRIAIVVLIGVVSVSYVASSIGRRLANVPQQSFASITGKDMYERRPGDPEDTIAPVDDGPRDITLTGEQVAEVARRSNRALMGVLLGAALTEVAATWCAIRPGVDSQWSFITVAAMIAAIQVLRARGFRHRRHAITVVCGAAVSLFAIPTHYGLTAPTQSSTQVLVSCAVVIGIAVCALLAGAIVPKHLFSEPIREFVEYLEYVATVIVVILAAWTIDLLQFTRYH
jgi:type VII secretion integral membrane protein EccD